jgi:hypothetical protein
MSATIEELRKAKERLDKEAVEIERKLQDALRAEREAAASRLLPELIELTARIDAMKEDRQKLLARIREAAPRLGDFSYAAEDYRLTLQSARTSMKQPELLDRLMSAFVSAGIHVEPRAPRFRLFQGLHPVGALHVSARRISITASDVILDHDIIAEARTLDAKYPGVAAVEMASEKKERRVREGVPARAPNGDYATGISVYATDTGTLDAILPLALAALEHVAAFRQHTSPEEEARLFEPWPAESAAATPQSDADPSDRPVLAAVSA